jgi:hypothetical protein
VHVQGEWVQHWLPLAIITCVMLIILTSLALLAYLSCTAYRAGYRSFTDLVRRAP